MLLHAYVCRFCHDHNTPLLLMIFMLELSFHTVNLYKKFDMFYSKKVAPKFCSCAHVRKYHAKVISGNKC